MNLCTYNHPKFECGGKDKNHRRQCKYFPKTMEDCPEYNKHGCDDCDCVSAQFEYWAFNETEN